MGGTFPACPFCRKECAVGGIKNHIKAKHPDKYQSWIENDQKPYWMYDINGELKDGYRK